MGWAVYENSSCGPWLTCLDSFSMRVSMNRLLNGCRLLVLAVGMLSLGLATGCDTEKSVSPPPPPTGTPPPAAKVKSKVKAGPISDPAHDSARGGQAR
jgi:hypothetical protein